jgi:hypothetical protein
LTWAILLLLFSSFEADATHMCLCSHGHSCLFPEKKNLDKEGWCPGFIETTPRVFYSDYMEITGSAGYPALTPQPQTSFKLITAGAKTNN